MTREARRLTLSVASGISDRVLDSECQRDPATTFPAASCSCYCHADKARECCDKCEPIHRGEYR